MECLEEQLRKALPFPVRPDRPASARSVIDTPDPAAFWAKVTGAISSGSIVALIDPAWPAEWKDALTAEATGTAATADPAILIPTSGSTGKPRFCIHNSVTLLAAASSFSRRFGVDGIIHSVNVLPQHHVGGLMPVLRSAVCGGRVIFADHKDPESISRAPFSLTRASLSLVPTQLQRMMENPAMLPILQQFGLILVGGSACPQSLLERARSLGLRLAPCYGSTETAAMVTALHPDEFLAGAAGVGTPLPGNRISIGPDQRIQVHSESCLLGYLPPQESFSRNPLLTSDLGRLDASGHLHVIGRADRIIISGGENVSPEQVEAVAIETGLVKDAFCEGRTDAKWGQRVILSVVPALENADWEADLWSALRSQLPPYAVPKEIQSLPSLPRNTMGKRVPGEI